MRKYELVVIIRASLKEAERKKLISTIKSWFKETKIAKEDDWGQRPLAYPIRHENTGYYFFWELESENGMSSDLEKRMLTHEDVVRHLLLRTK